MTYVVFGDRYVATGAVMRGGGGEVYICDDPNLERKVVVKFLLAGIDKRRLQDEIAALQRIRSKNVVQILDLVDDPLRGLGVVAEHLPGTDLTAPEAFPKDRQSLLRLVYQLANGVSDIHTAGIVHRDLKPNNVKYADERILKIFDFNLARGGPDPRTRGFRGTHGYAAPEQYVSDDVELTPAMDVYALAATIASVVNEGDLPRGLKGRPPSPTDWVEGFTSVGSLDHQLAELLDASLSENPSLRPKAEEIKNLARNLLRRDAHRATITIRGNPTIYQLDSMNRSARVAHSKAGGGAIQIKYDGLEFVVSSTSGPVLVNHSNCAVGQRLPDSCVIDLGSPSGILSERLFVTFDVSHPEVVQ